jgi:hypothetical protein
VTVPRQIRPSATRSAATRRLMIALRAALCAVLGVSAALLVACGSSGKSLIPMADAGPLRSDFEEVAQDAQNAEGNCDATTAALNKTAQDFAALPASVNQGLHAKLKVGIENLRERALALCAQPSTNTATITTTTRTTTRTRPVSPSPPVTSTQTTPTTPTATATTPTPPAENGGGTAAPSGEAPPGGGAEAGVGESGGASAGGSEAAK